MAEEKTAVRFAVCVNMVRGVNRPCCGGRGSLALLEQVEHGVRERGLNVEIERIVCLNKCLVGPNMRIVGGEIFSEVTDKDIPGILNQLETIAGHRTQDKEEDDGKIIFPGA